MGWHIRSDLFENCPGMFKTLRNCDGEPTNTLCSYNEFGWKLRQKHSEYRKPLGTPTLDHYKKLDLNRMFFVS